MIFCLFWFLLPNVWSSELPLSSSCSPSAFAPFNKNEPVGRVTFLPELGCVSDLQLAGLLPLSPNTVNSPKLFYWFIGSQAHPSQDPIILWLNGGPGASSFYGFFAENGPYSINTEGKLSPRPSTWSKQANYLILDQPSGVGLSYQKGGSHLADPSEALDQLYSALKVFFNRYPELLPRPLYLAGQSYAGRTLPELAQRIIAGKNSVPLDLKGILVGDGWVNPLIQQSANADYAYSHGLIDLNVYKKIKRLYQDCKLEIKKQKPASKKANQVCGQMQELIRKSSGIDTTYISSADKTDYHKIEQYLNRADVRKALHVDSDIGDFKLFSDSVATDLEVGIQDSVAELYPKLIAQGIRILIYNGLEDGKDCNFMGTDLWLSALNWPGKNLLAKAPTCIWSHPKNEVAGYARSAAGLTQVKIRNAGHSAPADQPNNVQNMLHRFIFEKDFCE